ncbi:MAG: DNA-3-methyladenine glycosylase [Nanoarchaeota archaeon]|nr:DNA-3-methyladenine glycosylase [Nanoarchaeota archaeon]MBU1501671.1 DNA-3-methyladenine glycosylase [Nanoarchaeota archaeon]MBU2459099.1 DNA-3-methyladenine glycosylase [Nanoarchaeota archaeon]
MKARKIDKEFFLRDAEFVARELLGKIIVRKINGKEFRARIVETEAYFGSEDPASRAVQNGDLRRTMLMDAGTILVYGIHNNWLVNFVTNKTGMAEAVLIRALEPMNFEGNTKGPGLLTKSLKIKKDLHKKSVCEGDKIWVEDDGMNLDVCEDFRIGIRNDLPKKLRFYIKDNGWVSRR